MPRPCHRAHPEPLKTGCRICHLYLNDPRYRRVWGDDQPCKHLGEATGETVPCQDCPKSRKVMLKIFACATHGTCTPAKKVDGHACCVGCRDYSVREVT